MGVGGYVKGGRRETGGGAARIFMEKFNCLLADDHVATRAGVRRALESHGMRVVAEAAEAHHAVAAALTYRPSVCLLAIHMPGNGISAAEQIRAALPATKIVMLTASDRDEDLFAALQAGADGYLLKQATSLERLPYAIRGVLNGEAALPRPLTARLIRAYWIAGAVTGFRYQCPGGPST